MTQPRAQEGISLPPLPAELERIGEENWKAFCRACEEARLEKPDPGPARKVLARAFALSDYVFKTALRTPEKVVDLIRSGDLFQPQGEEIYREKIALSLEGRNGSEEMGRALRRLRHREMVRIICRDLAGLSDLDATMAELSDFAETCIQKTIEKLQPALEIRWGKPQTAKGEPQHLVVVAMGKLGARELNLSSDIDLIFAYPENGQTEGGERTTTCEDFFVRLCRELIQVIGATTPEGFVFRVDARLRPYGENGPLAVGFDTLEDYYQHQGREWERYAWIKARVISADPLAGKALMARMAPFVYRRYLDYGAVDALRDMKRRIIQEVRRKHFQENVKIGPGGIREIEFFGQVFQLMRGGVIPSLRQRGIQAVLNTLAEEGDIDAQTRDDLLCAYVFLRNTEHRIQGYGDQQTHDLPRDEHRRNCLAAAMGMVSWASFVEMLQEHRQKVRHHFNGLFEVGTAPDERAETDSGQVLAETDSSQVLAEIWQTGDDTEEHQEALVRMGFSDPSAALDQLNTLRQDPATRALSLNGRQRLDRLIPKIMTAVEASGNPDTALQRLLDLIRTIQQRTNYLALLIENPSALSHLVRFADISPWILAFLSRHPVLLDELLDPRTLFTPPGRKELETEIERRLARIDAGDLEYQIESLCIFRQVNTLRVAAADITGALPLMRTSDHLTDIAETVVATVLDLAWGHLVDKHGTPHCLLGETPCSQGFAVIAYGKMGGIELGYGSDLDLVFLHAGQPGDTRGKGRPIDNAQFFARLGQRVVHILTAHTRAGRLYETDMRLRPSGSGGILVSHVDTFENYQIDEAWTWEHQALVRARPVAGDPALMARFDQIRRRIISTPREPEALGRQVAEMRQKIRQDKFDPKAGLFDLKQGNGGMVDIEFIVQYLILCHGADHPELAQWSDNVRQIESLLMSGILDGHQARLLRNAYLAYRAAAHRLNLQQKPAQVPLDRFEDTPQRISALWKEIFRIQVP